MNFPPALTAVLALLPFAGALLMAVVPPQARRASAALAGAVALAGLALALAAAPSVFAGEVLRWRVDWVPALNLAFGFRMDGLAWLFATLITGIGALIVLYAAYYLHHEDPARRFFLYLLLFMGAMLGIVLADNLILLVVFWELTSLASFLLIGYWRSEREAREGARMALAITGAGGLALLAGVLLLGQIVGSYDLDVVLASGDLIRADPRYPLALVLVLAGCFTKSAQFPFHFWLPHAMAAPTPVSAYLHSATMVKAGVFLLARLYPALGSSDLWFWIVAPTGLATLLIGAYIAIFKHDLKGLLAYSTISHLGLITLLFGLDAPLAVVAGVFHIICTLVAAMNPDDLDAMDESVPFTKSTLDNLLGVQHNEESYKYYFDCFVKAQIQRKVEGPMDTVKKNARWNYADFLRAPVANQIPQVQQLKKQLAQMS